jgi:hypothetical protein
MSGKRRNRVFPTAGRSWNLDSIEMGISNRRQVGYHRDELTEERLRTINENLSP